MDDYYLYSCESSCFSVDTNIEEQDPLTFFDAMKSHESASWLESMREELDSIEKNKV